MSDRAPDVGSRSEAVQPSLWDRLVDDLPGLVAESDGLRLELAKELGTRADIDKLVAGGARAIERRVDLDEETRLRIHRLAQKTTERRGLEERGIVVTADVLREAVRRDIEMLFNIERLEAEFLLTEREELRYPSPMQLLVGFPQVRSSVVNYGVPSFAGRSGSDFNKDRLAREIKQVLKWYEPRLKNDSVKVTVRIGEKGGMRIEIDGVLLLSPVPERLRLSTTIDLDNGQAATIVEEM